MPPLSSLSFAANCHDRQNTRKILVTSVLPYANGSIHLGHLLEYIQTDIWVRFQKSRGHECHYVCADDAHGTAIMLRAEQMGISPEQLIAMVKAEHEADFAGFHIGFDNYHSTHSEENRILSEGIYKACRDNGHIAVRKIKQLYDPVKELFLADRYIKGECPKCGTGDQYGDNREACGATYTPGELKNPFSTISGRRLLKKNPSITFKLPDFQDFLKTGRALALYKKKSPTNWPNGWIAACKSGTFPAMRLILVLKFPTPQQILLCLVGCAHRLYGQF